VSGLVVLVGGSREDAVRAMERAPHRGAVREVVELDGITLGVQAPSNPHPHLGASLHVDEDRAVVTTGTPDARTLARDPSAPGSYAAVVIDRRTGRVTPRRTHPGERPLFTRDGSYASEPKQLARPGDAADREALIERIGGGTQLPDRTGIAGVHRVLPEWEPEIGTAEMCLEEAIETFRVLLGRAVERRHTPTTGVLMSGGLDSTAVAAMVPRPARVVSARHLDHPSADETPYIQAAGNALGADVTWTHPRPATFVVEEGLLHDGPDIAPLTGNMREKLRAARAAGLTAMMDGHDGDVVFGSMTRLGSHLLRTGQLRLLRAVAAGHARRTGSTTGRVLTGIVRRELLPPSPPAVPGWVDAELAEVMRRPGPRTWVEAQRVALTVSLPLVLEHLERIGLTEGVPLLHPLADPDVVSFLASLPPAVRFAGGRPKALVQLGFPELPAAVRDRETKTSFSAVATAGATPETIREAIERIGRAPGVAGEPPVDYLSFGERALLARALSAGAFVEALG